MIKHCIFLFVIFSKLCLALPGPTNHLDRAIELFNQENFAESQKLLNTLIKDDEKNAEANFYLGRTYYELGNSKKAINHLKRAVSSNALIEDYHFWLGRSYALKARRSNKMSAAFIIDNIRQSFQNTLSLNPNHIGATRGLARLYIDTPPIMGGDNEKGAEYAQRLLKLDEKFGHDILAQIYTNQNQFDKALYHYELLEKNYGNLNDFYTFYNRYGYLLLKQEKYNEAIQKFVKQIELAPDSPNAYDSLGDGYKAANMWDKAYQAYQVAILLDPNFKLAKANIKKVEKHLTSQREN